MEFFSVLRKRVATYFEETGKSKNGNVSMFMKTILMLSLYFVPYFFLLSGVVTNYLLMVGLWILIGFGMAGIGLTIMHDANHRSYSSKNWVNKLMGYTMNIIGANSEIWKIQHNQLHHTFTNIEGSDDDIHTPSFLRFSPHRERKQIHRYQYIYVWFFYGISTLAWVTTKEFMQLIRYKKMGLIKGKKKYNQFLTRLILWKIFYWGYMVVLPMILIPAPAWFIFICFLIMHFVTGTIISMIFQSAHIMEMCEYPVKDENGSIQNNWAIHEMMTTANFSQKSRIFTWFIGGLNYQIEHHLFPSICHVHYRSISKIVKSTAEEMNIPYKTEKNFFTAIRGHIRMLYHLGRHDNCYSS